MSLRIFLNVLCLLLQGGSLFLGTSSGVPAVGSVPPVVLRSCTFANVSAAEAGGAVYVIGLPMLVSDCNFESCRSTDGRGGALAAESVPSLVIQNVTFHNNR